MTNNTGSALVKALEAVWRQMRRRHPDLPDVVIITGSGLVGFVPRWGHFWAERWQDHVAEEGAAIGSEPGSKAELFVAGERLACGAEATVQTMLHEAAHALAQTRGIKDTSRQGRWHNRRFLDLARELGLDYPEERPANPTIGYSQVVMTDVTRSRYATVIDKLESAIVAHLQAPTLVDANSGDGEKGTRTGRGTTAKNRNAIKLVCGCDEPRVIRAWPKVVELGPITCGLCGQDFAEEAGPGEPAPGGGDDGQDTGETDVDEAAQAQVSTKVRQLTGSNVRELEAHRERLGLWTVGRTFAVFHGSPAAALARVQDLMDEQRAKHGGRWHGYCSLIAVRNKLRDAAPAALDRSEPLVRVTSYVEVQTGPRTAS